MFSQKIYNFGVCRCNSKSFNRKIKRIDPTQTLKMWLPCSVCLVCAFIVSTYGQNEVRRPPSITKGPKRIVIFRGQQAVTLACRAEGIPAVMYEWKKNGDVLNLNSVDFSGISDGDITIRTATPSDEGFYQCFAKNMYGKAVSAVAHLRRAFLGDNSVSFNVVNHTVQEGRPFSIPAARRLSYPTPTYDWDVVTKNDDPSPKKYHQTQRVRSACNGDLYFAYAVKSDDELGGNIYKSTVFNANVDVRSGGSYTRVIVTPGPSPNFPPNITYFSMSQEVALIGSWIELKCFFSGKPEPTIAWSRPRSNLPSGPRSNISHFGTTLNISNIVDSDGGDYVCTATNANGTANHVHNIRVEAVPIFKQESDGPRDVNVTKGDSITFNCNAFAVPDSTVAWFQNGDPLNAKDAPKRFAFSSDLKSLTIRDVCQDCDDRESKTDLMVIQCNASNVHGYAFASGYLNVLLRTKVTLQQSSTFVSVDLTKENRFQFDCSATSDPSTPVTVQWYKVLDQGRRELVYNEPPYLSVMKGNLTLNTDANCSDTCHKYLGEYICVADNKYTQDNVTVRLNSTTERTYQPPPPNSLIWIVIGTAIGLFLLLLIFICASSASLRKEMNMTLTAKNENLAKIRKKKFWKMTFKITILPSALRGKAAEHLWAAPSCSKVWMTSGNMTMISKTSERMGRSLGSTAKSLYTSETSLSTSITNGCVLWTHNLSFLF